jgi:hypothetical protein
LEGKKYTFLPIALESRVARVLPGEKNHIFYPCNSVFRNYNFLIINRMISIHSGDWNVRSFMRERVEAIMRFDGNHETKSGLVDLKA